MDKDPQNHYLQAVINEKAIEEDLKRLYAEEDETIARMTREEQEDEQASFDNIVTCTCCGWDDAGYTHEPNCLLYKANK